jgi:predicted nucleotidyltransferase
MDPTSPYSRGLVKIHKPDAPIRPVVNWINAPAYKLPRKLVQLLTTHLPLPCAYNIKNSLHLIRDLCEIPWNQDLCMASFDISNMYTNIHTDQLADIINTLCHHNNVDPQQTGTITAL